MSTPTAPLPSGPQAAANALPDLADMPERVRHAIGAELLYALRILPRPRADHDETWLCPNHPFGHDWTDYGWPNVPRVRCSYCGTAKDSDAR